MIRDAMAAAAAALAILGLVIAAVPVGGAVASPRPRVGPSAADADPSANDSVLGNFSAALGRIVTLIGAAGGALLAIVWARVALSWFSNDVTKKVQAKDRARDALVGTLIFAAALSGIIWGLAHWVLTGT